MNHVERLIQELCPDGVECRELRVLARRNKGISITARKMKEIASHNGEVRIFAGGNTFVDVALEEINAHAVVCEPSIVIKSRGNIALEYYDKPFTHKSEIWSYTVLDRDVEGKFVFYFLQTQVENLQNIARSKSVKLPQLSVGDTDILRIPVPPIEVQREIVRILDKFSALEAELEAELEARRKQYEFYRSTLVNGSPSMQYAQTKLSDIVEYVRESCPAVEVDPDTYVGVDNLVANKGGKRASQYVPDGGRIVAFCRDDILFGNIRPYLRKIWLADASGGCSGDVLALRIKRGASSTVVPRYLYHALASEEFFNYMGQHSRGGKMPRGDKRALMRYVVSIPTVEAQKRVADILDRFDALVNDISIGLPAELEARRKQYEYYRDKLLTFKELPA